MKRNKNYLKPVVVPKLVTETLEAECPLIDKKQNKQKNHNSPALNAYFYNYFS